MTIRIVAILAVLLALAGTHWRAYTRGEQAVRLEWDADTAQRTAAALKASEQARAKEQNLQAENRRIANAYAAEKTRRADADRVVAGMRDQLTAALDRAASDDPAAIPGADGDPRNGIIAECSSALVRMDSAYRGLAAQTIALQNYTAGVCLAP